MRYGLLRTEDAISQVVSAQQTAFSLVGFILVYLLLFGLFVFLLNHKIQHGPEGDEDEASTYEYRKDSLAGLPVQEGD